MKLNLSFPFYLQNAFFTESGFILADEQISSLIKLARNIVCLVEALTMSCQLTIFFLNLEILQELSDF